MITSCCNKSDPLHMSCLTTNSEVLSALIALRHRCETVPTLREGITAAGLSGTVAIESTPAAAVQLRQFPAAAIKPPVAVPDIVQRRFPQACNFQSGRSYGFRTGIYSARKSLLTLRSLGDTEGEWARQLDDVTRLAAHNFMDYCGTRSEEEFFTAHRAMLGQRLPLAATVGLHAADPTFWLEVTDGFGPIDPPGPIVLIFHFGWLPTAGLFAAASKWRPTVLANADEAALLREALAHSSQGVDMEMLATDGEGILIRAARSLRKGRTLLISADVSSGVRSADCPVQLPNGAIQIQDGPFRLAQALKVPMAAMAVRTHMDAPTLAFRIDITPAADPNTAASRIAADFSAWLRETPEQWLAWRYLTPSRGALAMSVAVVVSAAAMLPSIPAGGENSLPKPLRSSNRERRIDRMGTVLLDVVSKVLSSANWIVDDNIALLVNSYVGPMDTVVRCLEILRTDGVTNLSPIHFSNSVANAQAGHCAIRLGLTGQSMTTIATAPLYFGLLWLKLGRASRALVIDIGELDPAGLSCGTSSRRADQPLSETISALAVEVASAETRAPLYVTECTSAYVGDQSPLILLEHLYTPANFTQVWIANVDEPVPSHWRGVPVASVDDEADVALYGAWEARAISALSQRLKDGQQAVIVRQPNNYAAAYVVASRPEKKEESPCGFSLW